MVHIVPLAATWLVIRCACRGVKTEAIDKSPAFGGTRVPKSGEGTTHIVKQVTAAGVSTI